MTRRILALVLALGLATPAEAQRGDYDYRHAPEYGWLLLGALVGFVSHEGGHLFLDGVLRTHPTFEPVHLGPLPFFAIQPNDIRTERQLYAISMMGFLVEGIYTETILTRREDLVQRHKPFLEGMLAFHAVLDVSYAITGFAGIGPPQSDVNSMARAAGIPPWAVSLMLIAPVAFDIVRYADPDSRWAPWVSRAARVVLFGSVFCFRSRRL